MLRLSLELPTVLQVEKRYAILFHEGGVSQFRYLDRLMGYQELGLEPGEPGRIWALVDANENLPQYSAVVHPSLSSKRHPLARSASTGPAK